MKLESSVFNPTKSPEMVSCVCWLSGGEVMLVSEDQLIKFNPNKNISTTLTQLPATSRPTDMKAAPNGKQAKAADIVAIACSDGKLMMLKGGRVERAVDAHIGAVMVVRWSGDGQAMATGGEDGIVKLWSPTAMLRSTLHHSPYPVYSLAFSPCNSKLIFSVHKSLTIKPLQPNSNDSTWKAHEGLVSCVDWNSSSSSILSSGEDCKYKVWDNYGRLVYSSSPLSFPATSLAWTPSGEIFVVANFHNFKLCDSTGWTHHIERSLKGSLFGLVWNDDGTRLLAGCGSGGVVIASVIDRQLELWPYRLQQSTKHSLTATNLLNDACDVIDLHDIISLTSLHHNHLVITTGNKCYIYSVNNLNVPVEVSIKDKNVTMVKQSTKHFLLLDASTSSAQVFTYAGKLSCTIRHPSIHPFNPRLICMNDDIVVVVGKDDGRVVQMWDVTSGKMASDKPLIHEEGILEMGVDQMTSSLEKRFSLVDKKQHLFMVSINNHQAPVKVKSGKVVDSVTWCEDSSLLAYSLDVTCYLITCPVAIFTDRVLFNSSIIALNPAGEATIKRPMIESFQGNRLSIRGADGCCMQTTIPPQVSQVHTFVNKHLWDEALKLCRLIDKDYMWACLGGLALWYRKLNVAESSFAALDQPDKVRYLCQVSRELLKEVRESGLMLLIGKRQMAEGVLLQHNNIFRAIMLNIGVFNWERALELALKHKSHIDTVVAHRQKYLENIGAKKETLQTFKQYSDMKINWETIEAKMKAEYNKEK